MDELELLKKEWNRKDSKFKNYTESELFTMIKGKSVSVVKTLLILGLIETFLWLVVLYIDKDGQPFFSWEIVSRIVIFGIFIGSIIFYYFKIKNERNTLALMKNILTFRKLILIYMGIMLGFLLTFNLVDIQHGANDVIRGMVDGYNEGRTMGNGLDERRDVSGVPPVIGYILFILSLLFGIYLISRIYKWVYGPLLKKLKLNYNELLKLKESDV